MKKIVGISVLSLVVLIFGVLPWVMGLLAQRAMVDAMKAGLPANSPVTYQLVSYQRHWFSSDVVYTVTSKSLAISANQPAAAGQTSASPTMPTGILVTETVYHGPIVFTRNLNQSLRVYIGQAVGKGIVTSNPAGTSFQSFFPNATVVPAGAFQELTTLGLSGRLCVNLAIPALTVTSNNSASVIKTSPMNVFMSTNHSLKKFGFGVQLAELTATNQGKPTFMLTGWDMQASVHKSPEQLFLGQATVKIADITANAIDGQQVELQSFKVTAQSDIKRKLLNSDSQLTFARLTVNNKPFGPGIAKLSFKRFDPKAQAELAKLNSYATPQTPWAQAAMVQEASRLVSKLIAHGAQIIVSPVNVKTSDGDIDLGLSINFPNVKGKNRSLPMQLHQTNAAFQLTLPKVLAHRIIDATNRQQIQLQVGAGIAPNGGTNIDAMVTAQRTNQVNNWLSRGFVVSHGDDYTVKLSYKQGIAYVNGKALKDLFAGSGATSTTVQATAMPVAGAAINAATAPAATTNAATPATAIGAGQVPAAAAAVPVATTTAPTTSAMTSTAPTAGAPAVSSKQVVAPAPTAVTPTVKHQSTSTAAPATNNAAPTPAVTSAAPANDQATAAATRTALSTNMNSHTTATLIAAPVAAMNQAAVPTTPTTLTVNKSQPAVSTAVMRSAGVTVLTTSTPTVSLSVETGR